MTIKLVMAETDWSFSEPIHSHSIQNDLVEENTPLLYYGQTVWVRNVSIAMLLILFCIGLITGLYLLFSEEYESDSYKIITVNPLQITMKKLQKKLLMESPWNNTLEIDHRGKLSPYENKTNIGIIQRIARLLHLGNS